MKIFHTADWHLGKIVQGVHMTEDQRYILDEFIRAIDEEQPDVVIIAGDLYDRAIPPVEAVDLLDDVLSKIAIERHIPVLAIAGNHDSPTRLEFGRQLMGKAGLHIIGNFSDFTEKVVLHDAAGEVHFHLIPFAEPTKVRATLQDEEIHTYDDAMQKTTAHIASTLQKHARHVAIAHAFVTPAGEKAENTSDSERPLAIGGTECVDATYFEPFHYTALGHLHRAHYVKHEKIRYAGSPLKYSASEATHDKGFLIVDLAADGTVEVKKRPLRARRDMRIIEGTLQEIMRHASCEDYVFVHLTDETPVIGAMEQIRTVYKNALHVERRIWKKTDEEQLIETRTKQDEQTLFHSFMTEMTGEAPSARATALFREALHELLMEEREEVSAK